MERGRDCPRSDAEVVRGNLSKGRVRPIRILRTGSNGSVLRDQLGESVISIIKRALEYPGRFFYDRESVSRSNRHLNWYCPNRGHWYDTYHHHSGIDVVTPQQAHGMPLWRTCGPKPSPNNAGGWEKINKKPECKNPRTQRHKPARTPKRGQSFAKVIDQKCAEQDKFVI